MLLQDPKHDDEIFKMHGVSPAHHRGVISGVHSRMNVANEEGSVLNLSVGAESCQTVRKRLKRLVYYSVGTNLHNQQKR